MVVIAVGLALSLVSGAAGRERPRYDVPRGYGKCPSVTAWNGFFKWVSVRHTTCRRAQRFLRVFAATAERARCRGTCVAFGARSATGVTGRATSTPAGIVACAIAR